MKLGKRKTPSGSVTFFLQDHNGGERLRESLDIVIPAGSSPFAVKELTKRAEAAFILRADQIRAARKGTLRDDAVTLVGYAESLTTKRDVKDHVVRVIPFLKEHFGSLELRAIDYRHCEKFQAFLASGFSFHKKGTALAPKTQRHMFNALVFVLNEAVRDRHLEKNPALAVRRVRVPEKVVISLTSEELHLLWQAPIGGTLGAAVKRGFFVSANSGLRLGDLRSLRWGDIKTGTGGWRLVKAQDKTGNLVTVPLNQNVRELLTPFFSLDTTAFVFPEFQTGAGISKYMGPWVKTAGLTKPVTFHTARHTFGTLLAQQTGGNARMVQNLMGHVTAKMTEHYTQAAGQEARAMVDGLPDIKKWGGQL